ncbi:zinc finger protein 528-like isoform X3 [Prionailurus iriomotensis]
MELLTFRDVAIEFLSGGVGVPGPRSEGLVQGRDVGELQDPGLPG